MISNTAVFTPVILLTTLLPDTFDSEWDDLLSIGELPWFSRIWIIQELLSSQRCIFLCGKETMTSEDLLLVGYVFQNSPLFRAIHNFRFDGTNGLTQNFGSIASLSNVDTTLTLVDLLWTTTFFQSTDPRDKIFALVHLANDVGPTFIDYDLSERQLLVNVSKASMSYDSLDTLCWAQCLGDTSDIPSWVAQWASPNTLYHPLIVTLQDLRQSRFGKAEFRIESQDVSRTCFASALG
jgi:hypothetical protein